MSLSVFFRQLAIDKASAPRRQAFSLETLERVNAALTAGCVIAAVALAASYRIGSGHLEPSVQGNSVHEEPVGEIVISRSSTDGQTGSIPNLFAPETSGGAAADPLSRFKVTGIILDGQAQAVLKDLESGKSFFVFKGDRVGEATVGDIQEGKVVLSWDHQSRELRP